MLNKPKFGIESFLAGADIIRQGDIPEKFYIITEGRVEVVRHDTTRNQDIVMNYLEAGEYFGEIGMVNQSRRIATVRATSDVQVMTMNSETFANWMQESDMVSDEIQETIARRMVNQKDVELVKSEVQEAVELPSSEDTIETALAPTKPRLKRQGIGPRHFRAGDVILRQGDHSHTFYIIVTGRVEVVHLNPDDEEIHIAYLDEGSYFGEIGMLQERRRIATVRAVTDVEVMPFDQETFKRWMAKSPSSYKDIEQMAEQRSSDTGYLFSASDDA